jgi:hypothetical protein
MKKLIFRRFLEAVYLLSKRYKSFGKVVSLLMHLNPKDIIKKYKNKQYYKNLNNKWKIAQEKKRQKLKQIEAKYAHCAILVIPEIRRTFGMSPKNQRMTDPFIWGDNVQKIEPMTFEDYIVSLDLGVEYYPIGQQYIGEEKYAVVDKKKWEKRKFEITWSY